MPDASEVARPEPAEYQPRLRWYGHAWRVVLMLGLSALVWLPALDDELDRAVWWWVLDVALGAVAYVLVFLRRRFPLAVAVVTGLMTAVSGTAAGPATLAAVSVATHRRWRELALVGALAFGAAQVYTMLTDSSGDPFWLIVSANAIATAGMLAWGMYIGSRRELLWTLRVRAERAEAEQELRVAQSRLAERGRIAREMHDVLAHRISQISMRAGALVYRDDLTAEEMRADAAVIRETAHHALTDLRAVLGVLRDEAGEPLDAPQPTYADLPALVADARGSGMRVTFVDQVSAEQPVPDGLGRTLYRIVQEGLTNAHKHARDAELRVEVSGTPGHGLDVVVANPLGFRTRTPGAGLGLVGLAERAGLAGGTLEHGVRDGQFVLRGWLPWPT